MTVQRTTTAQRATRAGEIALAILTAVIFVVATASIVIMLGLLPDSDIAQLRLLTEQVPFSGETPGPEPLPLTEDSP